MFICKFDFFQWAIEEYPRSICDPGAVVECLLPFLVKVLTLPTFWLMVVSFSSLTINKSLAKQMMKLDEKFLMF